MCVQLLRPWFWLVPIHLIHIKLRNEAFLYRQWYIVSSSYAKCTYFRSLWMKAFTKCPKLKCKMNSNIALYLPPGPFRLWESSVVRHGWMRKQPACPTHRLSLCMKSASKHCDHAGGNGNLTLYISGARMTPFCNSSIFKKKIQIKSLLQSEF